MRRIFLDTETTGLSPEEGDRVVEIAAIAYNDRTSISVSDGGEYHQYINPQRTMPPDALKVHGLSDDFLADKPLFTDIADNFINFISGAQLIIHNAAFDVGFLNAEFKKLNKPKLEDITDSIECSLEWSRKNIHGVAGHSLNALCRHFNINLDERAEYHSAIVDTRLLGELYFRMRQQQTEIHMDTPALAISATGGAVPVRSASADELQAHNALLAQMHEETGTAPLYHQQRNPAEAE